MRRIRVGLLDLYAIGWLLYALGLGVAVVADLGDARSYIPWLVPVAVPGVIALLLARLSRAHLVGTAIALVVAAGSGTVALVASGHGRFFELVLLGLFPLAIAALLFASAWTGRRERLRSQV